MIPQTQMVTCHLDNRIKAKTRFSQNCANLVEGPTKLIIQVGRHRAIIFAPCHPRHKHKVSNNKTWRHPDLVRA